MDFRKLHIIIGELEFDNIKLASQGEKQALNILALTQAFRILEHNYRNGTECKNCGSKNTQIEIICNDCANIEPCAGADIDLKNGKLPIPHVSDTVCDCKDRREIFERFECVNCGKLHIDKC